MNRQVTSSDINRSRIHLRGGKRVEEKREASQISMWSTQQRENLPSYREKPASFFSYSFFFFFASFLPFLFPFFAKKKRQPVCPRGLIVARLREGDQFVSRRNILGKWSGRPCKSLLVNFILRLLDPYAESAPRFTATKSLTASTDPYPGFTPSSFSIKQARENIYNYRLSVSLLILYDWSRLFRNNFKQF